MQAMLSAAYQLPYRERQRHTALSLGASVGMGGRTIQYQYLYFDNQYTGDQLQPESTKWGAVSEQLVLLPRSSRRAWLINTQKAVANNLRWGLAYTTSIKPRQSFLNDKNIRLRSSLHYQMQSYDGKSAKKLDLVPEAQFQYQDTKYEMAFGAAY
jgi:hypothetical protein